MGLTMVFYVFIYIHDLPHTVAKKREHPHEEAIHVACWLSLFTLHTIWPLVFIWAVSHKKSPEGTHSATAPAADQAGRIADLEARLRKLETVH